ncbi:hypothetical protein [Mesorhizobium sp.]|uniref:hypothetical protein n=1 Tax=Mesorhizobium sp. TaxID=1871066 RepID=UPI000FE9EF65|nr:hypothetical protein [Mesorhizobium sp.]RWN58467.1 MAG: hypothetical protein EOS00_21285 [Mesorhizobium sp.]
MTAQTLPPDQPRPGVTIMDFKPIASAGALVGFVDVHVPAWYLKLFGCAVFDKDGRRWVSLPSRPALDRDKRALTGADGKVSYNPCVAFDNKDTADRFSASVIAALIAFKPDAFGTGNGQ